MACFLNDAKHMQQNKGQIMEIKSLGSLVIAAMLGSAITIGSYNLMDEGNSVQIEHLDGTPAVQAKYNANTKVVEVPANFTVNE